MAGWQAWITLCLILLMLCLLVAEVAPPYMLMMGTLCIILALNILTIEQALHGFSDKAMLAIAVLFIVARGIEESGGLEIVAKLMFKTKDKDEKGGPPSKPSDSSIVWVLLKFSVPVAVFSAFLANIPLVAMMIPPIVEFSRKVNTAPSKMLMPLSFAANLGGTMTIIGASTNLVVSSLTAKQLPDFKMGFFEIGLLGLPVTVAGLLYIVAFSGKLLPERLSIQQTNINAREYNVVLVVKPTSSLARKSVDQAGLRSQPGLSLVQVERDGFPIPNPGGDFVILPKDRLHFAGVIDSVLSLTKLDGLTLSEEEGGEAVDLNKLTKHQCLVEAVVASHSSMVDKRVSDLQFRSRYKAAIVAVHRHNQRINSAIGDIELDAGDCLLMVADGSEFVTKHRNNSTFALVSRLPGFSPLQRSKALIAAVLVLSMVLASAIAVELITAALFTTMGLLATKCLTPRDALDSLELPVLIMIASAFGISEALVRSKGADLVAQVLMGLAGPFGELGLLTCTYIGTCVFSLAITNSAAVTIMFPVALAAAQSKGLDVRKFVYILMMAASAGFMTPQGCPTNLMIYSPGGYKFVDYMVYGGPMQIWLLLITVGLVMTLEWWYIWWAVIIIAFLALTPILARQPCNIPKSARIHDESAAFSGAEDETQSALSSPMAVIQAATEPVEEIILKVDHKEPILGVQRRLSGDKRPYDAADGSPSAKTLLGPP